MLAGVIVGTIFFIAVYFIMWELSKKEKTNVDDIQTKMQIESIKEVNALEQYKRKYRRKYLLSQNEKNQYEKIKRVTDSLDLVLFSKVRLADIIEPVAGINNWKTYWNKIQSKHVDFLICKRNLTTLCVLEIDDKSHKRLDRTERDNFVNFILNDVSIEILHREYIDETELKTRLEEIIGSVQA